MPSQTGSDIVIRTILMKPTFKTMGNGKLGVVVRVEGEFEQDKEKLRQYNVSAILLDNVREFYERRLFPLSTWDIVLDPSSGHIDFKTCYQDTQPIRSPAFCPSCGQHIDKKADGHVWCINLVCPANSLGCVRRLLRPQFSKTLWPRLNAFLDSYLVGDELTPIQNLFEFKTLFFEVNKFDKRTNFRREQWWNKTGDDGPDLWRIETAIEDYFERKTVASNEFWQSCNFPFTETEMGSRVQIPLPFLNISPKDMLTGDSRIKDWYRGLSATHRKLIENNLEFLHLLMSTYEINGEVQWISV